MPAFEVLPFPARIGLVADTHLSRMRPLPAQLVEGLHGCDVIFHAGDIVRPWVLEVLSQVAPVHAVYGNNDESVPEMMRELRFERYFISGSHRIGLIHGHHHADGVRSTARQYVLGRMRGVVDWAVYGHSHQPMVEERDGLWMINPGSPTQPRWAPGPTYGVLEVGEIVRGYVIDI